MAANRWEDLVIAEGAEPEIRLDPAAIRKELFRIFRGSLRLRLVSEGGDNTCESELNACSNVIFDMGRYGIEFVASQCHADGMVITGPLTRSMARPLELCYEAKPEPKLLILAGTDAISGGIFRDSPALDRRFLDQFSVDLYIPGNPIHPLSFIQGVLDLIRSKK